MRILVTDKKTTVGGLREQLLSNRLTARQADAAITSLQALNPHVDLNQLAPGTVLFVPTTPEFQPTGSDSVFADVMAEFERLVKTSLEAASSRARAASEVSAAESADVTRTFKTAAFKRLLTADTELQTAVETANAALKTEKQERDQAETTLAAASKDALAALRNLTKTVAAK